MAEIGPTKGVPPRPEATGPAGFRAGDQIAQPGTGTADWESDRLARLAHEIKTPLSAIAAAAELMRDERLGSIGDRRYRGYAGDIVEAARHALSVVNRMMAATPDGAAWPGHSRGEPSAGASQTAATKDHAPAGTVVVTQLDPNDLVRRTASSLRALIDQARLTLVLELDPTMPDLVADAVALRQILLNLVTNAMRATPAGGRITLRTAHALGQGLTISVADTGCGIEARDSERRTAQGADGAGTGTAPGAGARLDADLGLGHGLGLGQGLGLPLVRTLAAANGARVTIGSVPGSGTCVEIVFEASRVVPV